MTTGQMIQRLAVPPGPPDEIASQNNKMVSVAFSGNGRLLAVATGRDGVVSIYQTNSGRMLRSIDSESGEVKDLAFHPQGDHLAAACLNGSVHIWDAMTGEEVFPSLKRDESPIFSVAFSPDGKRIAAGSYESVTVWDLASGRLVGEPFTGPFRRVSGLGFASDRHLVASTWNVLIYIWDITTGRELHSPLAGHNNTLQGLAISHDGGRIASASRDWTVRVWDATAGDPLLLLRGHTAVAWDVSFSADGNWLASASEDGTVRVWDARPLADDSAIEREALGALEFVFAKPLSKRHAIAYMESCPTIRPEARRMALGLIGRYREETDPERFYEAARGIVRKPHLNQFQYGFALQQAETACRLDPAQVGFQAALGMAQYRLGQKEQANTTLARMREAMKNRDPTEHREAMDCLREAETLIEGQPAEPNT
jgi:hypothetical protein